MTNKIEQIKTLAKAILDNRNETNNVKNGVIPQLLFHTAKAYRDNDAETVLHIEGNLEKTGAYYSIRGMFSKAKRVGKSDKPFTETDSISAVYASILKEEKENASPVQEEKAAQKAIMSSLKMDVKQWNSLTHSEKGVLLDQGKAILESQKSDDKEVLILEREEVKAMLMAYIQANGFEDTENLLAEVSASLASPEAIAA